MKKNKITSIDVFTHIAPNYSNKPFISVFFWRESKSNRTRLDPTPSSLLRVMRWQAATLIAARESEV